VVFIEVQVKTHSMNKEEFENIVKELGDLKNLPNSKLIEVMDKLSSDFDLTKNNIIGLTLYLDKVEELYNKSLEEFQSRK
jgi:hypothetical protein